MCREFFLYLLYSLIPVSIIISNISGIPKKRPLTIVKTYIITKKQPSPNTLSSQIQLVAAREAKNTIQPIAIKQCVQKYFLSEIKLWYKILSVSIVFLLYFIFLLNVYIYFRFFVG